MTECVNDFLFFENLAAYGAVLAFRKARVFTVGSYSFVDHFGMTECIDNILCCENLAAYGAVLAFRETGVFTVGCYRFVDHFGMTECRDYIRSIAVSADQTGIGSITFLGTGGSSYYSTVFVTELHNGCLSNQNGITYRTVLTFRKARCGTGRCYSFVDDFFVTKCINNCLCNKFFVTNRTVGTFRKTGFGTGRCFRCVNYFGMTESVNCFLFHKNFVTNRTVGTFRKTCCGTGRSYCFVNHYSMTLCSDFFLCFQNITADRAFRTRRQTGFGTGCRHCRDCLIGVTHSSNDKRCFGRCTCSCFVQEEGAASAALVMFHVSVFGTGRCLRFHLFGRMTGGINTFGVGMRRIVLTGIGHNAVYRTGRLDSNFTVIVSMTGCRDGFLPNGCCLAAEIILEQFAACSAGVIFIVAGCGTGCCLRSNCGHAVTERRDFAVCGVFTSLAVFVCIPTLFRTGSCLRRHCYEIVSGGLDGFTCNGGFIFTGFILENTVTSFADVVCIVAGFCTGCRLCFRHGHAVTGGFLFSVRCIVASRTGYICIPSDIRTGRFLCIVRNFIVTQCIDHFLCLQNFLTDRAFHSGGKTGFGTGCRYCRDSLLGMTRGGNNLGISLYFCPIENKCCCICFQTICCAGSFRFHNTCYCCF